VTHVSIKGITLTPKEVPPLGVFGDKPWPPGRHHNRARGRKSCGFASGEGRKPALRFCYWSLLRKLHNWYTVEPPQSPVFFGLPQKMQPNKDKSEIVGVQMRIEAKVLGFFSRNLKYDAARNT
jgi:hypothetical protein